MASLYKSITFMQKCDEPSAWTLSFSEEDADLVIGLHFGDKPRPAHTCSIGRDNLIRMMKDLGFFPEPN
jgi:hypothetical protein